ncbi:MAG: extracellular solute-binding protein [Erysipelothrix sp.]|nr:extracellular solute-binding protein [Erysipelothrix sp.]
MKKIVRLFMVAFVAIALTACSASPKEGGTYDLTLWGSQDDQELLAELVEDFKAANPDDVYNITLGVVGEPDAQAQVTGDLSASADVFAFPDDQMHDFLAAGALYEITLNKDEITEANLEGAIDAVTVDGKMYGIPFTADNGYFLYYDANFFSEDDVKSLDTMMEKLEAENKKMYYKVNDAWYLGSFFLGAGGQLGYDNGKQTTDFNNETGVKVGEYLANFTKSSAFLTGEDEVMMAGAADGTVKAAVSGAWKANEFAEHFGDGYRATKLPTIKLDGKDTQLGSFVGYKVYGVNAETEHPEEAMKLAEFLANEQSQEKRFAQRSLGPSNKKVAESKAVKDNIALNALGLQAEFAHSQRDVTGAYWGPAEAFGTEIVNGNTSDIKALLDEMVAQITE